MSDTYDRKFDLKEKLEDGLFLTVRAEAWMPYRGLGVTYFCIHCKETLDAPDHGCAALTAAVKKKLEGEGI